jgi:23S rRNA pseudouridine1911/1915/1917 synthase
MQWNIDQLAEGMNIRDFLTKECNFSRRMLKAVKVEGHILLNGKPVTVREKLKAGDALSVIFPEEDKGYVLNPKPIPLNIVYEDDDVIVLNKQAGLPVIPSRHHAEMSIAHGLLNYYQQKGLTYTIHVVTRLDHNTSGLMLVAKHRFSHSLLSKMQKEGKVKRTYWAFVEGKLANKKGVIDAPIGRKPTSIVEREVREDGKRAITHYEVWKDYHDFSHVEVNLETGRTHQIRVHFSYLGHPLLGDDLYGGKKDKLDRQALHCAKLIFFHPFLKKWLKFEAPLPRDMANLIEKETKGRF